MLHAMIQGELIADPQRRAAASGKTFVTATVRVPAGEDAVLVGVAAFGAVAEKLAALAKGDALAATGTLAPRTWTGKDGTERHGLNLTAHAVLTVYEAGKRRRAVQDAGTEQRDDERPAQRAPGARPRLCGDGLDDFPDDAL